MSASRSAFSLIELSIVLVILGLLTGGILSGQSLIRAAELRAVNTEFQRYTTAISSFRDKYFGIPGDFNKAGDFGWKDGASTALTNASGNGNGNIDLATAAASNETSTFWVHLANAGLIEGSYTLVGATSTSVCGTMTPGTNVPRSRVSNGGWNILGLGNIAITSTTYFTGTYGNALLLGGGTTCGTATAMTGLMKAEEAWNLDTKADDGLPDQGAVRSYESQGNATAGSGCSDRAAAATALAASSYDLTSQSSTSCALTFKTGY